jgi:hypothetical protein
MELSFNLLNLSWPQFAVLCLECPSDIVASECNTQFFLLIVVTCQPIYVTRN